MNLGELRREGPFGDHTGFYSLDDDYPVFHIDVHHPSQAAHLCRDDRRAPADGGLLHGQSDRAVFSCR